MLRKTGFFIAAMLAHTIIAKAESTDYSVGRFFNDGTYLVSSPLRLTREDVPMALGVSGSLGGIALLDKTIRHHLFPWSTSDPSEDLRHLGDYGQVAGPAIGTLFGLEGWLADDNKSKETAYLSYETFLWAGTIEVGIKYVVGRQRPSSTDDPFVFKPGSTNGSFPSGHATVAFAAATVFAEQYPSWFVIVPAYGAAGAIGFSRLYANQHWASDVAAGALLGYIVSHTLRARHHSSKESSWTINTNGTGIELVKRF